MLSPAAGAGAAAPGAEKSDVTGFIKVEARNMVSGELLYLDKVAANVTVYEMKRMIAIKLSADPEHSGPPIPACLIHMERDVKNGRSTTGTRKKQEKAGMHSSKSSRKLVSGEDKSLLPFLGLSVEELFHAEDSQELDDAPIIKLCYLVAQPKWQFPESLQQKDALAEALLQAQDVFSEALLLSRDWDTSSRVTKVSGAFFRTCKREMEREDGEAECKILYYFSYETQGEDCDWKEWRRKLILDHWALRAAHSWPRLFRSKQKELTDFMVAHRYELASHMRFSLLSIQEALNFIGPKGVQRILVTEQAPQMQVHGSEEDDPDPEVRYRRAKNGFGYLGRTLTEDEKGPYPFRGALLHCILAGNLVFANGEMNSQHEDLPLEACATNKVISVLRTMVNWFPGDIFEDEVLGSTAVGPLHDLRNYRRREHRQIRLLLIDVLRKGEKGTAEMMKSLGFEAVKRIARAEVKHANSPSNCPFFLAACLAISRGLLSPDENDEVGRADIWLPILDLHELARNPDWFPADIWKRENNSGRSKREVYRFCCQKKEEWFGEVLRLSKNMKVRF
ncbi:unnamed protein product [Amoebophrya sp. A25]|nr:unnamed protein product [Amoebophrya sp. A25]|eukprot:GSA25T00003249001.1